MEIMAGENSEKTKPIQSQTKPIYSYCVLRDAYCEKEF
jgi:hypothetical protein